MNEFLKTQKQFFEEVRKKLPHNLSLVDIICNELGISSDSAYRRIRGESSLSLDEAKKLCLKFDMLQTYVSKALQVNFM